MADNILKMTYAEADQMISILKETSALLQNTIAEADKIAGELEGGTLMGEAGGRLTEGLRSQFKNAAQKLTDAFDDAARYVSVEREDMMQAEKKSAALF